jgi:hypothetical protein
MGLGVFVFSGEPCAPLELRGLGAFGVALVALGLGGLSPPDLLRLCLNLLLRHLVQCFVVFCVKGSLVTIQF